MARYPRCYIEGVAYHLVVRSNHKRIIFQEADDFECYLGLIRKAKKKYGIRLYCYCIMPTHPHLLVKPDQAKNISKFMHWVNKGYTDYFNREYSKVGHLWQGRFRSKPILKDSYLENVVAYIENNPVRAKIVENPADYPWSSYRERHLLNGYGEKPILDDFYGDTLVKESVPGTK